MKLYEIGTGYTPIPAKLGAATEIVVEELAKAFREQRLPVEIIDIAAPDRAPHDLPIREVTVPKCFVGTDVQLGIRHKLKRVVYSLCLAGTLGKLLKESSEWVILHFHNQYNLFFFLMLTPKMRRKNAVIAYTNHSYIWHGDWETIRGTVRKRYFQEVFCMRQADHVFVLNQQAMTNIRDHIGIAPERMHLMDNGVNTDVYTPYEEQRKQEVKRAWGLEGRTVIIQVGSVCDRKNQLGALKLLLPLMRQNEKIVYCYAGGIIDPEYQKAIHRFAQEKGVGQRVRYAGELQPGEQLNAFYNLAEAMVFPSKAEGFPLVLLEAMSAGVPVVMGDNVTCKLAGQCLRYQDADTFETQMKEQILNPDKQRELSAQVRKTVCEGYNWDTIAHHYRNVWQ